MKKFIITTAFTLLIFGNTFGRVSPEAIQRDLAKLEKNLTETIDRLIVSGNRQTLVKLIGMIPAAPKGIWSGIEKDVFLSKIEKNEVTIQVLEEKIKLFSEMIEELNKILKSRKLIREKWDKFFHPGRKS